MDVLETLIDSHNMNFDLAPNMKKRKAKDCVADAISKGTRKPTYTRENAR